MELLIRLALVTDPGDATFPLTTVEGRVAERTEELVGTEAGTTVDVGGATGCEERGRAGGGFDSDNRSRQNVGCFPNRDETYADG